MPLLFSEGVAAGRITLRRFVELTAEGPARLMGLFPRKGIIAPGSDADLVFMDTDRRVTLSAAMLHSRADYTPFDGFETRGYPVTTMLRGKVIWDKGRFAGAPGDGAFLSRGLPDLERA